MNAIVQQYEQQNQEFRQQCAFENANADAILGLGYGPAASAAAVSRREDYRRKFEANGTGEGKWKLRFYTGSIYHAADNDFLSLIAARREFDEREFTLDLGSDSSEESEDSNFDPMNLRFPADKGGIHVLLSNLERFGNDPAIVTQWQIAFHPNFRYRLMKRVVRYGNCSCCLRLLPRGMYCELCCGSNQGPWRSVSFRYYSEDEVQDIRPFIDPFMLYELTEGPFRHGTEYFLDSKFFMPHAGHGYDPHDQDPNLVKTLKMIDFFDVMRHNEAWILDHEDFEKTIAEHFHGTLEEIQKSIDNMEDPEGNVGYPHHLKKRMMYFRKMQEYKHRVFYKGESVEAVEKELELTYCNGAPDVRLDPRWLARTLKLEQKLEKEDE